MSGRRVRFTHRELENMLNALNAAAASPQDWQDSSVAEMSEEDESVWLEHSLSALESAAEKVKILLSRSTK